MSVTVEPGRDSSQLGSQPGHQLDETVPRNHEPAAERDSVAGPGATAPARAAPRRHGLLQAGQSLLNVIVVALFIITFTVQPFRIPSESMEPTLLVGDFLLVNKDIGL
jgi:signal peptidase I